ncbi:MAG TPA: tRNA (guanine-N7)-methyltransferase [Polyangiaceae bacterium]|nr:tRNA (guanine-N7)-methyltransferase [Polyangiaceae bacterium]
MSVASNTKPKPNPYADAPRLPDSPEVSLADLVMPGRQVELEIGPGRGGFLFERLAAVPDLCMLGFEIRRKWATIVDNKLKAQGLGPRARVFSEDAKAALPRLPAASLARIYVHFPDPWWKKRHEKRLVVGTGLMPAVVRALIPGGELFVQTDVEDRAAEYEAVLNDTPGLVAVPGGPRVAENPFQARSPREHRAIKDGLPIHRLLYRKA